MTPSPIVFLVDVDNTLRRLVGNGVDPNLTIFEHAIKNGRTHDSSTNNLINHYRKLKEAS
jgi:hypothetical protein